MAAPKTLNSHKKVYKKTAQGGSQPKTASMNKSVKQNYKQYRGQGR